MILLKIFMKVVIYGKNIDKNIFIFVLFVI